MLADQRSNSYPMVSSPAAGGCSMDLVGWATLAGVPLASAATFLAVAPQRTVRREATVETFVQVRRHLRTHWAELASAAIDAHRNAGTLAAVPLAARPGWIPSTPLELGEVRLVLREASQQEDFSRIRSVASRYWPVGADGRRPDRYTAAIDEHDRPTTWFDSTVYRLLDIRVEEDGGLRLEFCLSRYFDAQDAGEILAYEVALRHLRRRADIFGGPLFRSVADPVAFGSRCAVAGINTLTVRVEGREAFFFMHRRSETGVGAGMSTTHVAPAGEFQPHADVLPVWNSDLHLSHTVMREYAEEFLGHPDAAGISGVVIDYRRDQPYARMSGALRSGRMRLYVLGVGLSVLTWKPEICTVCVWDAATFDGIFADMLEHNDEGVLVVGNRRRRAGYRGLPFTAENVLGYARDPMTLPEGRACLKLAWQWRDELGIPVAAP